MGARIDDPKRLNTATSASDFHLGSREEVLPQRNSKSGYATYRERARPPIHQRGRSQPQGGASTHREPARSSDFSSILNGHAVCTRPPMCG